MDVNKGKRGRNREASSKTKRKTSGMVRRTVL